MTKGHPKDPKAKAKFEMVETSSNKFRNLVVEKPCSKFKHARTAIEGHSVYRKFPSKGHKGHRIGAK